MASRKRPRLVTQDNKILALPPAQQAAMLDRLRRAGFTGLQQDVVWGDTRSGGQYDPAKLAQLQALFRAANARGIRPQVRLMGTPYYQQKSQPGVDTALSALNPNPQVMGQFAGDMARAFGGQVSRYSIWNEPNVDSFLMKDQAAAAAAYRKLYQAGYGAIKRANPNAHVGFGELTSEQPTRSDTESTLGFLRQALLQGRLKADFFAEHPYQWSDPSKHPAGMSSQYGGISNLPAVQQALAQYAREGKFVTSSGRRVPLSLSEFGYRHDVQRNAATRAAWLHRSLELATRAGAQDMNVYQVLPSGPASPWDSSIANAQGRIDPRVVRALRRPTARRR